MMTCKNCGSNDIIAIQDQNYCINCGQLVSGSKPKKNVKPQIVDSPVAEPNNSSGIASPKISKFSRTDSTIKTKTPADIVTPQINKGDDFIRKPLLDLRKEVDMSDDSSGGMPVKAHTYTFILKLALKVAFPIAAFLALALYLKLDTDIVLYGVIGGGIIAWLVVMALHSAIMYGSSKAKDGRIVPESLWWAQAKSRFVELLIINLSATIGIIILCVAIYGFYKMSQLIPANLIWLQIAMLLSANVFISWLLIGLLCIRRLIVAIITVGGQPTAEAFRMAWIMYLDYGGHLILSVAETLLIKLMGVLAAVVVGFGAYTIVQSNSVFEPFAYGLTVLFTIVVWFTIFLRFEIAIWLSRYRWIASRQPANVKSQLLAGGSLR